MVYRVRKSQPRDIMAIDALLGQSYPRLLRDYYPPSVIVTAVPLIARARPGLVASGTYFVAEDETGKILGSGGWTRRGPMGENDPSTAHIRHFATHPNAVRQGVGGAILKACFDQITTTEISSIACYSTRMAVPFYRRYGFDVIDDMDIELRPGISFQAICMERAV